MKHYVRSSGGFTTYTAVCNGQQFTLSDLMNGTVTDRLFFVTCPQCLKLENFSEQDKARLAAKNIVNAWENAK